MVWGVGGGGLGGVGGGWWGGGGGGGLAAQTVSPEILVIHTTFLDIYRNPNYNLTK